MLAPSIFREVSLYSRWMKYIINKKHDALNSCHYKDRRILDRNCELFQRKYLFLDVDIFILSSTHINLNMSMTTTITNAVKQRKLSDLRVVDLQRELRSSGILYDKKELKGALLEKLRQVNFKTAFISCL
jgi:hypothetical protein